MSEKRMKLVQDQLAAFMARDWESLKKNLIPRVVYNEPSTGTRAEGVNQTLDAIQAWTVAFPDLKGKVTHIFHQDDMVMAEVHWEGTHEGLLKLPTGEFPASGRKSTVDSVELFHFDGDKIREVRRYFDTMTLLQQIGIKVPTAV